MVHQETFAKLERLHSAVSKGKPLKKPFLVTSRPKLLAPCMAYCLKTSKNIAFNIYILSGLKLNYVGVRIYQGIRMIKRSEMRPLGGATFWDNQVLAVATILTPFLVGLKQKILPIRWCHVL